mgnify:CR=1 FL=1
MELKWMNDFCGLPADGAFNRTAYGIEINI